MVLDDIFVAGDVARWPHPLYDGQLLAVEHWGNAVGQARTAAHNMVCPPAARRAHRPVPAFWSDQFGLNIKAVGVPPYADQVILTQGSVTGRRFAAVYGRAGRTVAAVTVNLPRALEAYAALIEEGAPFPPFPPLPQTAGGPVHAPVAAGVPAPGQPTHSAGVTITGPGPGTPAAKAPPVAADPRTPPGPAPLH